MINSLIVAFFWLFVCLLLFEGLGIQYNNNNNNNNNDNNVNNIDKETMNERCVEEREEREKTKERERERERERAGYKEGNRNE